MEEVKNYYDENALKEWERLERHRLEFDITKKILDNYIGKDSENGLKIADIGGGPGRYSLHLAGKGHDVTLVDLSCENICLAIQKSEEMGIALDGVFCANVLDLDILEDNCYDACLLMGPLYHLLEQTDRENAVKEVLAKLKTGGIIISTFISRFAPTCDYLKNYPEAILEQEESLIYVTDKGDNIPSEENPGFTHAYFSTSDESKKLMESCGVKTIRFSAVESIACLCESKLYELDEETYEKWVDFIYAISTEPSILGASEHLIHVGVKV